jgi:hypothetical protein
VSGHEVADPAIPLMKSRRRIAFTKAGTTPNRTRLQQGFPTRGMGPTDILRGNNHQDRMSAWVKSGHWFERVRMSDAAWRVQAARSFSATVKSG